MALSDSWNLFPLRQELTAMAQPTEERHIVRFKRLSRIPVYLFSTWRETSFTIILTDASRCWKCDGLPSLLSHLKISVFITLWLHHSDCSEAKSLCAQIHTVSPTLPQDSDPPLSSVRRSHRHKDEAARDRHKGLPGKDKTFLSQRTRRGRTPTRARASYYLLEIWVNFLFFTFIHSYFSVSSLILITPI